MSPAETLAALAERHDLDGADIRAIGEAWSEANALLSPADLATGLAAVVRMYMDALNETPETFPPEHSPTARIVIDRAAEIIVARLQQAGRLPS